MNIKHGVVTVERSELLKEWDFKRNKDVDPSKITIGSAKRIWWVCEKNENHMWECELRNRTIKGSGCPYCDGKLVHISESLKFTHPHLVEEWDVDKNKMDVTSVSYGSSKKVWWICKNNNSHRWETKIYQRTIKGNGCSYCNLYRLKNNNSLLEHNPHLAKQWDNNNNEISAKDVSPYSNQLIWWICEKGHSFPSTVSNRQMGNGCPYCSNQKTNNDNCLATNYPNLLKEWDFDKNADTSPYEITGGSAMKIWWTCEKGHGWDSAAYNRTKYKTGCPVCKKSKGQTAIIEYLDKYNIFYELEVTFDECRDKSHLPFDIFICKMVLIEYDGGQHFESIDFFGGVEAYSGQVKRDKIKNYFCINRKIPFYRIPFWEFEKIECVMENILKYHNLSEESNYDEEIVNKYIVDENWNHDNYIKNKLK